ncbi:MAG: 7TM diverse intracellular signaling domain-containing protein, partial [Moraxellaceae bacterium]|nr:7TM diverse intracellular signaling domain-containing protein [Moraxellaceae bacterium]
MADADAEPAGSVSLAISFTLTNRTMDMARLFLLILFFWLPLPATAAVVLADGQSSRPVAADISYWREDAGELGHEAVLALPATAWKQNTEQVFSHGYNSAAWWLRFEAGNTASVPVLRLLEIAYPVLDEIEVWILEGGTVRTHYRLGDKLPFSARPIQHRFFVFPLNLPPESTQTILLRVRTTSAVQVPLTLWDARAYFEHDQSSIIAQGIYFGAMGLMAIYSLFVFLAMRERLYFYYVMYVVSLPVFLASINGFAFQYLWPEATQWNDQVLIVALAVTVFFGGLFTDKLLHIREEMPRFRRLIGLLLLCSVLIGGAAFFVGYAVLIRVTIVVAATACVCFLTAGALRWYRGDVSARFYTIAWSSMLLGGVVMALNKFQLLPQNFFTENATQTGSAITLILLSFSLLTRINEERHMRFRAQQD